MKNLYLKSGKIQDVFNEFKETLQGTLSVDNDDCNLVLNSDFVKGNISGISFPEGMTYLQFDIIFRDDVNLSMEPLTNSPIFFAYCSEGTLQHSIGVQGAKKSLKKHHAGILKTSARINSVLYFEKNIPYKFSIITVGTNKKAYGAHDVLITKLKSTYFRDNEDLLRVRIHDLKIAEKIEQIHAIKQKGNVGGLLKKEILQSVLAMEMERHTDSFAPIYQAIESTISKQIDEIKRVYTLISNSPIEGFTSRFLTQKVGRSSYKLLERFKMVQSRNI